ncbi:uncharacterized protein [Palaemon carinicauda]|uniref:uncharacterized protein n=1 Tax=Palaemon carinicauda TaxID=392227 RepID=UPI0035B64C79
MKMMWSTMLAILCGAGLITGTPVEKADGRAASSDLPVEHRNKDPHPLDVLGEMADTLLKSRTASALDEVASHFTKTLEGFVDNLGDFVVGTVKEIPSTIEKITERVGEAVQDGGEQVMIIVKGVRNSAKNSTTTLGSGPLLTVDKIFDAVNQSKTATSMQKLDDSIRLSIARIGATILANMGNIDDAVANGIRAMTSRDQRYPKPRNSIPHPSLRVRDLTSSASRPTSENEVLHGLEYLTYSKHFSKERLLSRFPIRLGLGYSTY